MRYLFIISIILIPFASDCQVLKNVIGEIYPVKIINEHGLFVNKEFIRHATTFFSGFAFGGNVSDKNTVLFRFERIKKEISNAPGYHVEISDHEGILFGIDFIRRLLDYKDHSLELRLGIEYQNAKIRSKLIDDGGLNEIYDIDNQNYYTNIQLGYGYNFSKSFKLGVNYSLKGGASQYATQRDSILDHYIEVDVGRTNWYQRIATEYNLYLRVAIEK